MGRWRTARVEGDDGGAIAVEFALVLPILVVLLFGIIDFGWVFNDWISLRQGSREGARQAVVTRVGTDTGCPLAGYTGTAGDDTNALFCLVKDRIDLAEDRTRVKLLCEDTDGSAGGDCDDDRDGSLVVCVMHDARSISRFFSFVIDDAVLDSEVQMRIETTAGATLAEAAEDPVAGADWTWCAAEDTQP